MIPLKWSEGWNRFFYRPIPAYSLGLFRIAFALVVLMNFFLLAPDGLLWYGEQGVFPHEFQLRMVDGPRVNAFNFLPRTDWAVYFMLGVGFVSAFCLLIGFQTRFAALVVWLCVVSFHQRNFYILHAGDTLMRNMLFLLMFAPSDKAYSLDRTLRIHRGLERPGVPLIVPWAQRLLQLQLCWMYLVTAVWKLMGATWLNGSAVYYVVRLEEFQRFPLPSFMYSYWFSAIASWGTIAVELAVPMLIWFRRLRYPVMVFGIGLHLGLECALNIPGFQWTVLASYFLFVDPEFLEKLSGLRQWIGKRRRGSDPFN